MHTKPQSWKDKYVAGYVALSAPLAGAAKLFRLYASGELFVLAPGLFGTCNCVQRFGDSPYT